MNKILRNLLMSMFMLLSASAFAQNEVTIDFDNDYKTLFPTITGESSGSGTTYVADGEFNATTTSTAVDGCTVTVTASEAGASSRNRIWSASPRLRMFDGTFTITAPKKFKKITMNVKTNKSNVAAGNTVNVGSLDVTGLNGTNNGVIVWTGDASEVVMTIAGNTQFKNIVISYDGGGETPTVQEVTVEQALTVINGLADNGVTEGEYKVTGYVLDVTEKPGTHKNITFIIADNTSATAGLTVFRADKFNKADITNPDLLKKGDLVVVQGKLQKYVKSGTTTVTPEISQGGVILSINGKTEDDTTNPEDAITQGKEASSPMTVEQALSYINGFSDGFTTTKQYYVQGTVSEVTEINTEKGNATFKMGNLTVFRVKGLENKNITEANYLKANDQVIICAKLQKYGSGENVTPELSGGYIYSLNGKTKEGGDDPGPQTLVGDGSKSNPYIVSDLKKMTEDNYPAEEVWVKGVIIGSAKSGTALNEEDAVSNIAIAESASETTFAPVALAAKTDFRTKLNLVDNPGNKGKEVLLCGKIAKYFSVTGVKDLVEAVFEGETISGIGNVTVDQKNNAPAYNVGGQRVNQGYKGLVIKGGRKLIQK